MGRSNVQKRRELSREAGAGGGRPRKAAAAVPPNGEAEGAQRAEKRLRTGDAQPSAASAPAGDAAGSLRVEAAAAPPRTQPAAPPDDEAEGAQRAEKRKQTGEALASAAAAPAGNAAATLRVVAAAAQPRTQPDALHAAAGELAALSPPLYKQNYNAARPTRSLLPRLPCLASL